MTPLYVYLNLLRSEILPFPSTAQEDGSWSPAHCGSSEEVKVQEELIKPFWTGSSSLPEERKMPGKVAPSYSHPELSKMPRHYFEAMATLKMSEAHPCHIFHTKMIFQLRK